MSSGSWKSNWRLETRRGGRRAVASTRRMGVSENEGRPDGTETGLCWCVNELRAYIGH